MNRTCGLLLISFLVLLFGACQVEFSPNAEWKEIPVVYGVLDQGDDTTYIRVQKCFLGEGNNYDFAQIFDSINYPEGSIEVKMLEWPAVVTRDSLLAIDPAATAPNKEFLFDYHLLGNKPEGDFYAPEQPIYVCRTAGQLDPKYIYQLLIIKTDSGDTIARAQTYLIGYGLKIIQPSTLGFNFTGTGARKCYMEWHTATRGRQYQPRVRFYYNEFVVTDHGTYLDTLITPHSIDIDGYVIKKNLTDAVASRNFPESIFLATIRDSIPVSNYNVNKIPIDTVDIFIRVCTEDLAAYLYSHQDNGSINQDRLTYTNIEGGLGVFAARSTHFYSRFKTPAAPTTAYVKNLKALGVGFYLNSDDE